MHIFSTPIIATLFAVITTGAVARTYSNPAPTLSVKSSSSAAITTPIPTSSKIVPTKSSAVTTPASKSSSAVKPTKTSGGGSGSGSGSDSGSGSGSGSGENGGSTVPTYTPENPAAKIDVQGATYVGAALGALGAFAIFA